MRRQIMLLGLFLILLYPASAVLQVQVDVSTLLDGRTPYVDIPASVVDSPQKFTVVWENTGSVGCMFRMQSSIYELTDEGERFVYTSWSEEVPIEPGAVGTLKTYWYPSRSGSYLVESRLHYCNLISEPSIANFSVVVSNRTVPRPPFEVEAAGGEEYVSFSFDSENSGEKLIFIPSQYPLGWAFPSKEALVLEGENLVELRYEASIWRERNITFDIVSSDGSYHTSKTVSLKRKEESPFYQAALGALVFLVVILLGYVLYLRVGGAGFGNKKPE